MALSAPDKKRLQEFLDATRENTESFLGYPVSKDFAFEDLMEFLKYPLNNLGDPFSDSTWRVDSRAFEREVITFFAEHLRAPANDWWGYVTNGGTEGNLYGLYLARELLPKGIVYYSQDTHYSVAKNLHFLGMRHIMIRSQANGEIDYDDLRETLRARRDIPPIIFANIGTTMTEAKDDLKKIKGILDEMAFSQRYIHSDAALCGGMAPFMEPRPAFDFADGADSISISGHKSFGSPIPCGIVLARKCNVDRIARSISYIGNLDTTITGSRNGFTPLVLWHTIKSLGVDGLKARIDHALDTAGYAETAMRHAGIEAWRNPGAITVVFPQVAECVKQKWQLATANGQSHVICMPNVTREQVDALIEDILANPVETAQ